MTFRDDVIDDLEETFFDIEEFAAIHEIDGVQLRVVVSQKSNEDVKMSYGLMKATLNPKETAINRQVYDIFIKENDFREKLSRKKITVNATFSLDGKHLFVNDVKKYEGYYHIIVGGHTV